MRRNHQESHEATGVPSGPSVRGGVTGGASCTIVLSPSSLWGLSVSVRLSSNCTTRSWPTCSTCVFGLVGSLKPSALEPGGESAGGWSTCSSSLGGVGGGAAAPHKKPNFLDDGGTDVAGETAALCEPFLAQKPLRGAVPLDDSAVDASDFRRELTLAMDGVEWCEMEDVLVSFRQSFSPHPAGLGFSSPTSFTPVQCECVRKSRRGKTHRYRRGEAAG